MKARNEEGFDDIMRTDSTRDPLQAILDHLKAKLTCREDAPHYCPNCDNSFGPQLLSDVEAALRAHPQGYQACPCLHTEPCQERCSCVMPLSSSGCQRCCSYGSTEQQQKAAEHIAAALRAWRAPQPQENTEDAARVEPLKAGADGQDLPQSGSGEKSPL